MYAICFIKTTRIENFLHSLNDMISIMIITANYKNRKIHFNTGSVFYEIALLLLVHNDH
jgi:ABC-type phosphate transport system ATPase subunit